MSSADSEGTHSPTRERACSVQSCDAVDLLPAPIWHIIFRRLLLPPAKEPSDSAASQRQVVPREVLLWEASSNHQLSRFQSGHTSRQQHEDLTSLYGSSWPPLFCAMASKSLLHHVLSFSETRPFSLTLISDSFWWDRSLRWLLQWPGLKSLELAFCTAKDVHNFGQFVFSSFPAGSPPHSITSLHLQANVNNKRTWMKGGRHRLMSLDFLARFGQLQRLELGLGRWKLDGVRAAWLESLRCLKIHYLEFDSSDFMVLAGITPQLHEFSLSSSHHSPCKLILTFSAARVIDVSFPQSLKLNLTLPPSLQSFSAGAKSLEIACRSSSPLSLDRLTLTARKNLVISSFPLASAKSVVWNGPALNFSSSISQTSMRELLRTIAPTVEVLTVRYGLPLARLDTEWSSLHSLRVGVNGRRDPHGARYGSTVEDVPRAGDRRLNGRVGFGVVGVGGSSTVGGEAAVRPPFLDAPKAEIKFLRNAAMPARDPGFPAPRIP